jgi:restriction endonuclease Mrr
MVELNDDERRALARKAREATLGALRALGGEGQRKAVREHALLNARFTDRELAAPPPEAAGDKYGSFVDHQLAWALTRLRRDGLVENPSRGVWRLAGAALEPVQPLTSTPASPNRLVELKAMSYREYLRSPEWRQVRAAALVRAGNACALDSSHTERLEVHHRSYERRGAELPNDVIVLCHECHHLHHQVNGRPTRAAPRPAPATARADVTATGSRPKGASILTRLRQRLPA